MRNSPLELSRANLNLAFVKLLPSSIFLFNIILLISLSCVAEEAKKKVRSKPKQKIDYFRNFESVSSLRTAYWSDSRAQDDFKKIGSASFWTKMKGKLGRNGKYVIDGWLRNDENMARTGNKGDLREAFVTAAFGPIDITAGRQLVVWGRADTLNPTDNLSSRNYQLLTPDDEDQKTGAGMGKLTYNFENFRLMAFYIPEFRPNKLPISDSTTVTFTEVTPEKSDKQSAFKIESLNGEFDWSVSYFEGLDKSPDLQLLTAPAVPLTLSLVHTRIRTYGADYAVNLGRFGIRAEGAYTLTEDSHGEDYFVKNPFLYLVLGGDRTFLESLNVNFQFLYRHIYFFQDPRDITDPSKDLAVQEAIMNNQYDHNQHGASLRIGNKWLNDTLEVDLTMVGWLQHKDYLLRPKVRYALNDLFKVVLGSDLYRGPTDSFFGSLNKLSTSYCELQWNF